MNDTNEEMLQTDARLGRPLVALQASNETLSASRWAAAAGVPTAEVGMMAEQLRGLGVEVEGSVAAGFRLAGEADLALSEVLEPKLAETIFAGGIRHFAKIGSTSAAAMRAGAEELAEREANGTIQDALRGAVWLAEEQTAAKGRAGHVWMADSTDGIYFSALLRPRLAPADVIILSLAAGLAVVEAVHEITGMRGDLRWPNDVLMSGRRCTTWWWASE